jgi:hypothetical protein
MTPGRLECPSVDVLRLSEGRRDGLSGRERLADPVETMR